MILNIKKIKRVHSCICVEPLSLSLKLCLNLQVNIPNNPDDLKLQVKTIPYISVVSRVQTLSLFHGYSQ